MASIIKASIDLTKVDKTKIIMLLEKVIKITI